MARPALTPDELDSTRRRILAETAAIVASEGYAALSKIGRASCRERV